MLRDEKENTDHRTDKRKVALVSGRAVSLDQWGQTVYVSLWAEEGRQQTQKILTPVSDTGL